MEPWDYTRAWNDILHTDVLRVLRDLYGLYQHATDSSLDDFDRELMCILDPEIAREHAGYNDTRTDVEFRNARTEVSQYRVIRENLSPFDFAVLRFIPDVWFVAEDARNQMEWEEHMFAHLFNIADFIERNKTA